MAVTYMQPTLPTGAIGVVKPTDNYQVLFKVMSFEPLVKGKVGSL